MSDRYREMSDEELEGVIRRLPRRMPPPTLWERLSAEAARQQSRTHSFPPGLRSRFPALIGAVALCCLAIGVFLVARKLAPAPSQVASDSTERATAIAQAPAPETTMSAPGATDRVHRAYEAAGEKRPVASVAARWELPPTQLPRAAEAREAAVIARIPWPPALTTHEEPPPGPVVEKEPPAPPAEEAAPSSSYHAEVTLADGSRSVLEQAVIQDESGQPNAIRIAYDRTLPDQHGTN